MNKEQIDAYREFAKTKLGIDFDDINLLITALTHRSYVNEHKKTVVEHNERLEFLGDAILGAVVGDIVYSHFEGKREGFLTNTRSKIVQRDTLNKLSQEMGLNNLIMSSGHNSSHNSYLGGNTLEALIGAIYLDKGYNACMKFVQKRILSKLIDLDKVAYKEVNFKSKLIEWCQKNRVEIEYKLLEQKKDNDGNPTFTYQVLIEGVEGCNGSGYSKKESQQLASKLTLQRLRREPQYIDAVFAAKTDRTKMEEEPTQTVPDTEVKDDFIIIQDVSEKQSVETIPQPSAKNKRNKETETQKDPKSDEFDLSDITHNPVEQTRESIIAAAEDAAFAEENIR